MKFLYHIYFFNRLLNHHWESHELVTAAPPKRACIAMTTPTQACAPYPTPQDCRFSGKARPPEGREIIPTRSWASKSRIYCNNLYGFIYTKISIYHIYYKIVFIELSLKLLTENAKMIMKIISSSCIHSRSYEWQHDVDQVKLTRLWLQY